MVGRRELRRATSEELGFHGVQVNSHTQGHYLDEPQFDPILRACAELDLPLYIHPQGPPDAMIGEHGRRRARRGRSSASRSRSDYHAMRLMTTGVFDRYPNLQLMLGHGCEGLPHMLLQARLYAQGRPAQRALSAAQAAAARPVPLHAHQRAPGDQQRAAVRPTAIKLMLEVMGEDRVMYAMDYPYQYVPDEVRWMDDLDITPGQKKKFFQTNAERWFKL